MAQEYTIRLVKRLEINPTVTSFFFEKPEDFKFQAGQYVKMILNLEHNDNRGNSRFFTIASSPTEKYLQITTKMQPSEFKRVLYSTKPGEYITIRGPFGIFTLGDTKLHHVFISGGVGITPFRSMTKFVYDSSLDVLITHYAAFSSVESAVFVNELTAISREMDRSSFHVVLNSGGDGDTHLNGPITLDFLQSKLANLSDCLYYITGPEEMVQSIADGLREVVRPERIRTEDFPGITV